MEGAENKQCEGVCFFTLPYRGFLRVQFRFLFRHNRYLAENVQNRNLKVSSLFASVAQGSFVQGTLPCVGL